MWLWYHWVKITVYTCCGCSSTSLEEKSCPSPINERKICNSGEATGFLALIFRVKEAQSMMVDGSNSTYAMRYEPILVYVCSLLTISEQNKNMKVIFVFTEIVQIG